MKYPTIQVLYSYFKESSGINTDTRKITANSIYFSLKGDSFDGNKFAEEALKQGSLHAVVDDKNRYKESNYILVHDVLTTLQDLACYHRKQLKTTIVAITGSNGKTTTKELINKVLTKKYRTFATHGNLNNHIGVPLTLLSIREDTEIAIVEMGANHMGEIESLCKIALPDYGMITNIGKAHIGEFGSYENIITGKTEMYLHLKEGHKKAFVNSADSLLMKHVEGLQVILYGIDKGVYAYGELISSTPFLELLYEGITIHSQLIGVYNFENIVAAICIGKYFGVSISDVRQAIEEYVPTNNRSQMIQTNSNEIVLDAYNANPSSMSAAIHNFYQMKGSNKWLILGDMFELGMYEIEEHKNIIKMIEACNFKQVILVGIRFEKAALELKSSFPVYKSSDELLSIIQKKYPLHQALILIKGSRSMKLERLVGFFLR